MSATEGMYDVALKPKLLRSLLREYVPDEKHPFSNHSELSYVVSTIKTHKLLCEWTSQPVEQDLVDAWKSAVDSWVNRLLTLASSNLVIRNGIYIYLFHQLRRHFYIRNLQERVYWYYWTYFDGIYVICVYFDVIWLANNWMFYLF